MLRIANNLSTWLVFCIDRRQSTSHHKQQVLYLSHQSNRTRFKYTTLRKFIFELFLEAQHLLLTYTMAGNHGGRPKNHAAYSHVTESACNHKKRKIFACNYCSSNISQNTGRMVSHLISCVNAPQEVQNQFTNARTAERDEEVQESLAVRNTLTTPTISIHR